MSTERDYPTDGSDEPWELLQELRPKPQWEPGGRGRPPVDRRRVLHGIFSLKKTGDGRPKTGNYFLPVPDHSLLRPTGNDNGISTPEKPSDRWSHHRCAG